MPHGEYLCLVSGVCQPCAWLRPYKDCFPPGHVMRHKVRPTARMHEWVMKCLSVSRLIVRTPPFVLCLLFAQVVSTLQPVCVWLQSAKCLESCLNQLLHELRWSTWGGLQFYSFTHTHTHWIVWLWDYKRLSVFQASESVCVWDNNANNIITFTSYWRQPAVNRKQD